MASRRATLPCPSRASTRAAKPSFPGLVLDGEDEDAAGADDAEELVEALGADVAGGEDAGADRAGEAGVLEGEACGQVALLEPVVDALGGGDSEHAGGEVDRLRPGRSR